MRNTYSPWEELASQPHLELRREPIGGGRLGEYVHHLSLIRLDPRMGRRQARSVLCHELVHAHFEDVPSFCVKTTARQEARADQGAARKLITLADLVDAMVMHEQQVMPVAVELRVSRTLLEVRLQHLHPAERHHLSRQLLEASGVDVSTPGAGLGALSYP